MSHGERSPMQGPFMEPQGEGRGQLVNTCQASVRQVGAYRFVHEIQLALPDGLTGGC